MTFSDCTDITNPVYYLGRVGDLAEIRMPKEAYDRTPDAHVLVHDLLDGQTVDQSFYEQRTWSLDFGHLTYAQRNVIEEVRTGARGLGPYVFIDPHTVNCFTPNIASGTNVLLTTEGFSATGTGESLASSNTIAQRGTNSLAWTLSPVVTGSGGGVLCMSTSYCASGWATPENQAWSMTGYVSGGGADPIVEITPQFVWLDISGQPISTTSGTPVSSASGSWTTLSVSGTAPTGVAYVHPRLVITPGSVSASTIIYVDTLILDMRNVARTWVVGEGQPRVAIAAKKEVVPIIGRTNMSYTLYELSA